MTPYVLSHSEYRTYKGCRRAWYLAYHRKLKTPPEQESVTGARNLGLAVHLAMEGYYGHDLDAIAVVDAHYTDLINTNGDHVHELLAERAYAVVMVKGYLNWAAETGVDAEFEVVGSESDVSEEIELPTGETVLLRGRLDQVVRRRGGDEALLLRDFKTASGIIDEDVLKRDEQMRFYSLLQWLNATHSGDRVDGALYTQLIKSKRTARAAGPFYVTHQVRYNASDYRSMRLRVEHVAAEIIGTTKILDLGEDHRAYAYPNPGDRCKWCPFAKVCTMADDGSRFEDALTANYVVGDPMAHYANSRIDQVKELLGG